MDGIIVAAVIFVIFIVIVVCLILYKGLKRIKDDRSNKKFFLTNASQIKKGQCLDEVLDLLGRPTSYSEMDSKYILKWEQTEETGFNSIVRSITVIVDTNEIVTEVHRKNMK